MFLGPLRLLVSLPLLSCPLLPCLYFFHPLLDISKGVFFLLHHLSFLSLLKSAAAAGQLASAAQP